MRVFVLMILAAIATRALGQPAGVDRVLKTIDFEERRLGNDEDLPMHWVKLEGPGFPHYVNGHLTTDRAHGGQHSFRLDLNGGSLVYRYEPNRIRIHTGAHYRVEGYVSTAELKHARARITAYFTDADGHAIVSSVRHSELFAGKASEWKRLSVELSATDSRAAFLVLELGLLQPEMYAANSLGERTLHAQDIGGTAWFDDVSISQVPRVKLMTGRPGNVFRRSEPLKLEMEVGDPFTEDLAVQMVIRDAAGRTVYQRSGATDVNAATTTGPMRKLAVLPLPDLDPGWYRVAIVTSSQGMVLGSETLDLVRLADDAPPVMPDDRFGIIATGLAHESWGQLPSVLRYLGAGRVKLGVWTRTADAEQLDPAAFDNMLVQLQEVHVTPTACLLDLPPSVSRALDEKLGPPPTDTQADGVSWLRILKASDDDWQQSLDYLISRHANHLDRWQLGSDGSEAFVNRKGMRDVYARVYGKFATLIQKPDLAMPWPAWYEMDGQLPATVALSVPSSILPSQLPLYMQDLKGAEGHHLSLSLQLLERTPYGRETQIRDLAERVVYALAAGAQRIDLPVPFDVQSGGESDAFSQHPTELFLIMRTLFTTLGNARYTGRVPIADGVEAFLFDRNGQGVIALWDTGRGSGVKQLAINLGDSPRMLDLWGNNIPLVRPIDDKNTGTVQLTLGSMPVFLTDIDGPLVQLRASVALDRPLIESTFRPHTRHIRFTNTYPTNITGTLRLRGPQGWVLSPASHNFSLNPGETFDREFSIEFPFNTTAGSRVIQAEFAIQGEKTTSLKMPLGIKLGLSDVGMQTMALRDGNDVIVQQIIQNYGDKTIDYSAFAVFPGEARQERLVTNLGPGRTIVKRFRFANVKPGPTTKVRVGVKEIDGSRVLNDEVEVR